MYEVKDSVVLDASRCEYKCETNVVRVVRIVNTEKVLAVSTAVGIVNAAGALVLLKVWLTC